MPEYLAPGVYVEEVPSGSKPIEGASTSTAALVGLTQRGPENTPTLVTSFAAYKRVFGGYLPSKEFTGGMDALPYAADGFFSNGGTRLFITRIIGAAAAASSGVLLQRSVSVAGNVLISRSVAPQGTTLAISGGDGIAEDDKLVVIDQDRTETTTVSAVGDRSLSLAAPTASTHVAGDTITRLQAAEATGMATGALAVGASTVAIGGDHGIVNTNLLLVRDPGSNRARDEVVTVTAVEDGVDDAPDTLTVTPALTFAHAAGWQIRVLSDAPETLDLAAELATGSSLVPLGEVDGFSEGDILRIGAGAGAETARVARVEREVTVSPLAFAHAANIGVAAGSEGLGVFAASSGAWGNTLRIRTREAAQVTTQLADDVGSAGTSMRLGSAFGLFPGSVIVVGIVRDPMGKVTSPGTPAMVRTVNSTTGEVTLDAALGAAHLAGVRVESQEFSLTVERIEDGKAAESETFERLSLAPDHPRNIGRIIGTWDTDRNRPSRNGGSNLIRISIPEGAADNAAAFDHRVLVYLRGGSDGLAGVNDQTYIGTPSVDPLDRKGIYALENEPVVSLVAVPGRTSLAVQNALVEHCERMRYRFAVLDTPIGAKLDTAREHRQNFDTTRAAVYYPGLIIPDRFGAPGELLTIASSGHVIGVMARTDTTRGVHKAPANEVLRGILQLETKLGKGEQDILNPLHVNCHRDFREQNRALRIYGARVATSDPEYKYVNVRRLMLFIEQSIDTGLQWAVFEPNSEPLWATVRQSVSNFLTTVWRSGALAGLTKEEAFFVNIGYDLTMTQDDLDNGRMIVEIGVAPVKPAEFVIARISQKTREATS